MLDRKVRNIDLGARTETFKYPPHLAQKGRSEGLLGLVSWIKYWWLDLSRALCGAGLFLQKSVVQFGCDQAPDHIYTGTYAIKIIKQTPWPNRILSTYLIDPLGPPEGPPRPLRGSLKWDC